MDRDACYFSNQLQHLEWTAPERLALASLLHGGPTPSLQRYKLLEIGCGTGTNLIPLAYYRPQADFIGVDQDSTQTNIATARSIALQQSNLSFESMDLTELGSRLETTFDFILIREVASRMDSESLIQLLDNCHRLLKADGLLYLNYDSKPGWNIRGMVREYLIAHTANTDSSQDKALQARIAAGKMVRSLSGSNQPYRQLLNQEFKLVADLDSEDILHHYLMPHHQAYWRSELLHLAEQTGHHYVADADYTTPSHRSNLSLRKQIESQDLAGTSLADTQDLLSNRYNHAPIFSKQVVQIPQAAPELLMQLDIASCLHPAGPHRPDCYQHPEGFQLQAQTPAMAALFDNLLDIWPKASPLASIADLDPTHLNDLATLHHNGLVELRMTGATHCNDAPRLNPLNQMELQWYHCYTTEYHQRVKPRG